MSVLSNTEFNSKSELQPVVQDSNGNCRPLHIRGRELEFIDSTSVHLSTEGLYAKQHAFHQVDGLVVSTATDGAIASAQSVAPIFGGCVILQADGVLSAGRAWTYTAASFDTAFPKMRNNDTILFTLVNLDAADTITVTAGAGVTGSGTLTVAATRARMFQLKKTAATTYTLTGICTWAVTA